VITYLPTADFKCSSWDAGGESSIETRHTRGVEGRREQEKKEEAKGVVSRYDT